MISKKCIEDSIKDLVAKKLYRNEAQLQFDLAWEIRKALERNNIFDWHVELEYLSATSVNIDDKIKNYYTDIILLNDTTGEFIPIELKYKTKSVYDGAKQLLKTHGAQDLGRFDFLWDVHRIESLKNKWITVDENLKKFCKGFAIMITNDRLYFNITKASLYPKEPDYLDFCIGNGQKIEKGKALKWHKKAKSRTGGDWRNKVCPLVFDGNYECKWVELKNKQSTFKSLIFEIK